MKIVAVSDTHKEYEQLTVPKGDVFVHAGDIDLWDLRDAVRFNEWLGKLPHKEKVIIGGNHDRWLAETSMHQKRAVLSNATYLENSEVVIDGYKFWGSPITPQFNEWYFMEERGDKIDKYWQMIPKDTDVLITHGPPYQILDNAPKGMWVTSVGCYDLKRRSIEIQPKIHIFGHVHFNHGFHRQDGVRFYNVSAMDENYVVVNKVTQIPLNKGVR